VVRNPGGEEQRSLEVAHIFMLGTTYSEPMGAYYLLPDGSKRPIYMCSYGMGIERTVAAYVETYFKENERDQV
jgi:prolyl-tRNA synthetase